MNKESFYPLLSPREVIEAGSFGGSYFGMLDLRTNGDYNNMFNEIFNGLDISLYEGETYKPRLNKFKTRSGMPYEYWKEKGWMHEDDPYGWFEWYCKYYLGRRHEDDKRQIQRWKEFCGINGRWRKLIYRKIYESGRWDISPRIQQSLLHWGYYVNEIDYNQWIKSTNHKYKKISYDK